jgi:hypothetical protein
MKSVLMLLGICCFAFADGQTGYIKVKKDSCRCKEGLQVQTFNESMADSTLTRIFHSSGYLKGKVVKRGTDSALAFATVKLLLDDSVIISGCTDIEGDYVLKPVPEGKYDMIITFCDFEPMLMKGIILQGGKTTYFDSPPLGLTPIGQKQEKEKKKKRKK